MYLYYNISYNKLIKFGEDENLFKIKKISQIVKDSLLIFLIIC